MYSLLISPRPLYRITRHILLFVSMVFLFSWVAATRPGNTDGFWRTSGMVLTNAVFFFGYAYLTVYLLIPRMLLKRRMLLFTFSFLVAGLALSELKFAFSDYIFYQAISPEDGTGIRSISLAGLLVNTKDMTFIVAVFALAKYAKDRYVLDSNILELQRKGLEAELKLLEHQMDPHVIFNNFNSLYSISINKPGILKPTVKKLSSVLHYLFTESKRDKVLLTTEVEMIENYLGLEKLRFGERLKITFLKEGMLEGLSIAPLILYSFVENCIVHGAGENPHHSWIRIELKVKDTRLYFLAANSITENPRAVRGTSKPEASENSLRRLELQYPNSHRITIRERSTDHLVELNVSL